MMRRLVAAAAVGAVAAVSLVMPAAANAAESVVIGGSTPASAGTVMLGARELSIGLSTRADIVRAEGRRPDGSFRLSARFGGGSVLVFNVPGARCWRQYTIPSASSRMGDFETNCGAARTYNGVQPGMTAAQAAIRTGLTWTPAQYGSHVCPLSGSVLAITTRSPYLAALSDASSARVDTIGLFATDPMLAQVARCGASSL